VRPLRSGSRWWLAAAVLTLPGIKLSFGSSTGAGLNDDCMRYCGRTKLPKAIYAAPATAPLRLELTVPNAELGIGGFVAT
jgi:hypothetical protein